MAGPATKFSTAVIALLLLALGGACPRPENVPRIVRFSDPLSAKEHAQLGAIYEREQNYRGAVSEYAAALKKDPENLVALTGLGNVSLAQGKPRTAAGYYSRALKIEPDNPVILNNAAMAWLRAGRPGKALKYADRAVALDDHDPRIFDTRGRARLAAGDPEGARADQDRAASLCAQLSGADPRAGACAAIKSRLDQARPQK